MVVYEIGADVRLVCTRIGVFISTLCRGPDNCFVALPFKHKKEYGRSLIGRYLELMGSRSGLSTAVSRVASLHRV